MFMCFCLLFLLFDYLVWILVDYSFNSGLILYLFDVRTISCLHEIYGIGGL